jgi:hypothetical protein
LLYATGLLSKVFTALAHLNMKAIINIFIFLCSTLAAKLADAKLVQIFVLAWQQHGWIRFWSASDRVA